MAREGVQRSGCRHGGRRPRRRAEPDDGDEVGLQDDGVRRLPGRGRRRPDRDSRRRRSERRRPRRTAGLDARRRAHDRLHGPPRPREVRQPRAIHRARRPLSGSTERNPAGRASCSARPRGSARRPREGTDRSRVRTGEGKGEARRRSRTARSGLPFLSHGSTGSWRQRPAYPKCSPGMCPPAPSPPISASSVICPEYGLQGSGS